MAALQPVTPGTGSTTDLPSSDPLSPQAFKSRIDRCKRKRNDLIDNWQTNVDYLRGKPFDDESDEDRVYVNVDWSYSARKVAGLASQLPEARLQAKHDQFKPALPGFARKLNDVLKEAGTGDAMHEATKDCVNAAGFGVVLCAYEARTMPKMLPVNPADLAPYDPSMHQQLMTSGAVKTTTVPQVLDARYTVTRISPSDFLWPLEFTGSNFDNASWLGHSGRMSWSEAMHAFNLTEDDKEDVLGTGLGSVRQTLRDGVQDDTFKEPEMIEYDEIFYWRYRFDPKCTSFKEIWRIVFAGRRTEPVVHEAWKGQQLAGSQYLGAVKFPLRILTLQYVSDDPIPPSDSAIARPQVNELMKSRTQMILQRERAIPVRWHNTDRLDPLVAENLTRGVYQNSIPVQGPGDRVLGEVARPSYPQEDFAFDNIVKTDLKEAWRMNDTQLGDFGKSGTTKYEVQNVQATAATQIGFERTRVAAFFTGIAEVIGGLLSLYGDMTDVVGMQELQKTVQAWNPKQLASCYVYSVLPDATVLLDSNQKVQKLMGVLNLLGKSPFINPMPLVEEILELSGIDPSKVLVQPQPQPPDAPNISVKLDNINDPLQLAFLMKSNQGPRPEDLQAAINALMEAAKIKAESLVGDQPVGMPQQPGPGGPGAPGAPGAPGQPPMPPPGPHVPPDDRAHWTTMPRIDHHNNAV